jgi:mRNA-degrading endonuclease RelE of RelBE toxin-antitoxin system
VLRAGFAECAPRSVGSAKYIVCGLRSLLRYLCVAGRAEDGLEAAVPKVAGWRLVGLPVTFGRAEVARLLASCDRRTTLGWRDYAVLVVLSRLGLRAWEVATAVIEFVYARLAINPRRVGRPLRFEFEGRYSARRGDYRIGYGIDDERTTIVIDTIAHRSDVYRPPRPRQSRDRVRPITGAQRRASHREDREFVTPRSSAAIWSRGGSVAARFITDSYTASLEA